MSIPISPTSTNSDAQPRRGLNFSRLVALTFFCVAGGAYGLEDAVSAGGALIVLLGILILPWLWSFPTALMTAELSTAMPEDGGYVVWVDKAFGRFWAFQEGWLSWLCSFADNALYPVMFLDYLAYLRGDMPALERWLIGTVLISAVTWLNIRGTRLVGLSSLAFGLLVLAPFLAMFLLGIPQVDPTRWLQHGESLNWPLLLSTLLWNTSGWDNAGCCASEVTDPQRTYPRAMVYTVLLVTAAYLLPVAVGIGVDANSSTWKEGDFPKVAALIGGPRLGTWLTIGGLVSAVGMLNALLCTSARVPYAMAVRGMLPRALATRHETFTTPWKAILANSLGVAALIPSSFQDLIEIDMFLYAAALILEFAALIWLRIKQPELARPYRVPGGVAGVIAMSIAPVGLCLLSIVLSNNPTRYVSIAAIGAGLLVYRWQSHTVKSAATEVLPVT
ncbi:MAG TPA: APC family permease [Candidatus Binatus sp.]|nr:APC family permease [Candidatus Binatus sp.]